MLEVEIQNRIKVGFCLGFAYFGLEEDYDYSEFILYLGLISIHFKNYVDERIND